MIKTLPEVSITFPTGFLGLQLPSDKLTIIININMPVNLIETPIFLITEIKPLFLIGQDSESHSALLKPEIDVNLDILEFSMLENYSKLGYKIVAGFLWIARYVHSGLAWVNFIHF